MAQRRYARARAPRRSMEWIAGNVDTVLAATGAGVVRTITLVGQDDTQTVIRIVGSIWMAPTSVVDAVIYAGIFKDMTTMAAVDPGNSAHVAHDYWLWWTARTVDATYGQAGDGAHIPIDIRVKRKLKQEEHLSLVFNCSVAYTTTANLRVLRMPA